MNKDTSFLNKFLHDVKNASENDKLVLFVGSGVSRFSGMPSWYEVIKQFAKELGIEKFGAEDYLDIPEKYYNKYGVLEYNKTLEAFFNVSVGNIDIQKSLFELNPSHIITTNWDNLLELASNEVENNEYSVVSSDHDLSRSDSSKLIIKMHGSFENLYKSETAIVMKYSDYFNYDKNFPLIDTYVKSIFATKRVVFLGYSLSDKNVQQILDFVKNRTNHHIYPYFVTFGNYNKSEFDNYKKQGVFIVYANELCNNLPTGDAKYKIVYEELLHQIKIYDGLNIDEKLALLFAKYDGVNFIAPNILVIYIKKMFDILCFYGIYGDSYLYIDNTYNKNNVYLRYLRIFLKRTKRSSKTTLEIKLLDFLNRSNITGIVLGVQNTKQYDLKNVFEKDIQDEQTFNYLDNLLNFDYKSIEEFCTSQSQSNLQKKEELGNKLQKAFIAYKQEDYSSALSLLKEIKRESFEHKFFFYNGIAKINIKNICRLDKAKSFKESNFCSKFDLNKELANLPSKYLDNELRELLSFEYFYKEYFQIQKLVDENIKTKEFFEQGGFRANNHHIELYQRLLNILITINYNFLAVDFLIEIKGIYKKSFEALVVNYSIKKKKLLDKNRLYFSPQKLNELNRLVFYSGVISSEAKELDMFLRHTLQQEKIVFSDLNLIINQAMKNLLDNNYAQFDSGITILSHTNLKMYQIFGVLKHLIWGLRNNNSSLLIYDTIERFLVNQRKCMYPLALLIILERMFEIFIDKCLCGNFYFINNKVLWGRFFSIVVNIFLDNNYQIRNIRKKKIEILINIVDEKDKKNYEELFFKLGVLEK